MPTAETNFDAICGPTHNYAGLSVGNLASLAHTNQPSNPKQAALEGLAKMKFLADLGVSQAVLPPHERPDVWALKRLGFSGSDAQVLDAARKYPALLAACGSASAMWAANAATVSPSADTRDGRVHFTPANLITQFHRSLEPATTAAVLKAIFADESAFEHHDPLMASPHFADEGAANHTRLCPAHGQRGLEIFVFGRRALAGNPSAPARFPARQTLEASESVARLHGLDPDHVLFLQQNPRAIDAGAFHNDVVAVGNLNVLMFHASAFVELESEKIRSRLEKDECPPFGKEGCPPLFIEVPESRVPLGDAVSSYLFNSQLVSLPDEKMALIAPMESRDNPRTREFLDGLLARETPIRQVHFVDVRQSMNNGGGPACLRLRVVLTDRERSLVNPAVFLTEGLYESLNQWINRHYRDRLTAADLADPQLLDQSRRALDELTRVLKLGSIYPFQGRAFRAGNPAD
ncbi:MAG: N-succinylarginine dihydrolase [Tepidisphaeraceae bacterium]|jgi:succinylarginine dihydrolase